MVGRRPSHGRRLLPAAALLPPPHGQPPAALASARSLQRAAARCCACHRTERGSGSAKERHARRTMVLVSLQTISPSHGCMYSPASTTSALRRTTGGMRIRQGSSPTASAPCRCRRRRRPPPVCPRPCAPSGGPSLYPPPRPPKPRPPPRPPNPPRPPPAGSSGMGAPARLDRQSWCPGCCSNSQPGAGNTACCRAACSPPPRPPKPPRPPRAGARMLAAAVAGTPGRRAPVCCPLLPRSPNKRPVDAA